MPVHVNIPIRIRIDSAAATTRADDIEAAVEAAVLRALANSREEVVAQRGGYVVVRPHMPTFTWMGDGLSAIPRATQHDLQAQLERCLVRAINDVELYRYQADDVPLVIPPNPSETVESARLYERVSIYNIPAYDGEGDDVAVDVERGDETPEPPQQEMVMQYRWVELDDNFAQILRAMHYVIVRDYAASLSSLDYVFEQDGDVTRWQRVRIGALYVTQVNNTRQFKLQIFNYPTNDNWSYTFPIPQYYDYDAASNTHTLKTINMPPHGLYTIAWGGPAPASEDALFQQIVQERRDILNQQTEFPDKPDTLTVEEYRERIAADMAERTREEVRGLWSNGLAGYMVLWTPGGAEHEIWVTSSEVQAKLTPPYTLIPLSRRESVPADQVIETEDESGLAIYTESADSAVGDGDGAGQDGGDGAGQDGGGTSVVVTDDERTETNAEAIGVAYPPLSNNNPVPTNCDPLLGEVPLSELHNGSGLEAGMREIAQLLNISMCDNVARFCINAAYAVGARASQVAVHSLRETGFTTPIPQEQGGNLGNMEFEPLPSPAIQYMRHLAGVVYRLDILSDAVVYVMQQPENISRVTSAWRNDPSGWGLHFYMEYTPKIKESVAHHFARTCQILLLQLLQSSKTAIESRLFGNFDNYAERFEQYIVPQLQKIEDLMELRSRLRTYATLQQVQTTANQVDEMVPDTLLDQTPSLDLWLQSTRQLTGLFIENNMAPSDAEGDYGEIHIREGTVYIFGEDNLLWSMEQLESAITMRRGIIETIDPLVKQLTEMDEVMDRFRNTSIGVKAELRRILTEMHESNAEILQETRDSYMYAVRASQLNRNIPASTIPYCSYALHGIHKLAHEQIGEFFRGAAIYGIGIDYLLGAEDGRQGLMTFFEFTGILLLSVVCPPLGMAAGIASGVYHLNEAYEREELYRALIDPELVLSWAEVEAELFAAQLGLALSFIPEVGGILGRGAAAGVRLGARGAARASTQALRNTARAGVRGIARSTGRYLSRATMQQLERGLARAFVEEFATDQAMEQILSQVMQPIMQAYINEVRATGPVGGMEGAIQLEQQRMLDRLRRQQQQGQSGSESADDPNATDSQEGTDD
jgi:hypothetical protein